MRNRVTIATAALLLASASALMAQQLPTAPMAASVSPVGTIDFGYRGIDTTNDGARYERYRDLRQGSYTNFMMRRDTETMKWDAAAFNIGYHDQKYTANANTGRARFNFVWDSIPLNYGVDLTSSVWTESLGSSSTLTLSPSARALVQSKLAVGIPQNAAQVGSSIYFGMQSPYELQSRRDTLGLGGRFDASENAAFDVSYQLTQRNGHQPWGASYAFNVATEVPMPLDNHTNDVNVGFEWTRPEGMLRAAYMGSWFQNNIHDLTWDNPYRATDTSPYDPSGYSNGNGPARGRLATAPSNDQQTVSLTGLYKMAGRSTLNGNLALTENRQNDALIPWTINPVIANPSVYASFPGLASLPRSTADAKVRGVNGLLNYTTRPSNLFAFNIRYRFNDHKNLTPMFDATEYVRFDAVPEETGGETEPFNIRQNNVNFNGTFEIAPRTSLKAEYILDKYDRTSRAFASMTDYIGRLSLDFVGNEFVTVRGLYEYSNRVGSGLNEEAIVGGGAQPDLRFYDEADRLRNRGSVIVNVNPTSIVDLNFIASAWKDEFGKNGQQFGLLEGSNTSYTGGVNINPTEQISFGATAGWDKAHGYQQSRNSNPTCAPSCPGPYAYDSWFDPNRNWTLTNDERVTQAGVFFDVARIAEKVDVRFGYDYEDSTNGFGHGGPRIAELQQNKAFTPGDSAPCSGGVSSCFIALPQVKNTWHRFTTDVRYMFTRRVGVAGTYWYEKFAVSDFATVDVAGQPGVPQTAYLGELSTGYGNRPYKGQSGFLRLLYLF